MGGGSTSGLREGWSPVVVVGTTTALGGLTGEPLRTITGQEVDTNGAGPQNSKRHHNGDARMHSHVDPFSSINA